MAKAHQASDILIIGGGVIGLACAWRLARKGLRVTLLERERVGGSASWASAGVLAGALWHRRDTIVQFQRDSLRMWPRFAEEVAAESGVDPEYTNCGSLELLFEDQQYRMARSEVAAADKARHFDFRGSPVLRLLTRDEARHIEPALTGEAGVFGVKHSTFTSQVRTPRLLRGLAIAAQRAGATIVEGCEATSLLRNGERVVGAATTAGEFLAERVVLCAGAWSSQLIGRSLTCPTPPPPAPPLHGRESGTPPSENAHAPLAVYPVRGQLILLKTSPGVPGCIVKHRKCYVVPRSDGHVLVGSTEEHESGFDCSTTDEGVQHLLRESRRLVPALEKAEFVRAWAGLRPGTPDRRPYIGPVPGCEGLIAATGHFRTGFGLTPLTAEVVADLVLGGCTKHDISRFQPGRKCSDRSGLPLEG